MNIKNCSEKADAFTSLERGVHAALETYSNVHRGSGHNSMVTTHLFEQARDIVLEYLDLNKSRYVVIFCTPRRASLLIKQLEPGSCHCLSSQDIGLSLGLRALAVERKALPRGAPLQTGGGTTRLISREWIVWADPPDRFEAGTPAIVNVIAFARALRMVMLSGKDIFRNQVSEKLSAGEILYHDELEKYTGKELLEELRKTLIGRGAHVPTMEGSMPFINLDNSASTPTFTPVWNVVRHTWRQPFVVQQEIIHEVRSICAGFLGAPVALYDVIFTTNTTEAINLVAESFSREPASAGGRVVLNTLAEHSSNDLPWRMVPGCSLIRMPVDAEGFLNPNELENILCAYNRDSQHGSSRIRLVAVSGASNVLGACSNLAEISIIVHRYGARLLVDAAQLVAHRKIDVEQSGIDYLAFSAHKVYAPFGTGVLVARKGLLDFSHTELEVINSSGDENAGGIAALGKAFLLMQGIGMEVICEEEQALTSRMLQGLAQIPGIRIYGIKEPDSPAFSKKVGVVVFGLKGMMSDRVARELVTRGGIGVRFGCHCAHILIKHLLGVPPLLERFQRLIAILFAKVRFPGLVRVSLGIENTEAEIDTLIGVLHKIAGKSRATPDNIPASFPPGNPLLTKSEVRNQMNQFTRDVELSVYSIPAEGVS